MADPVPDLQEKDVADASKSRACGAARASVAGTVPGAIHLRSLAPWIGVPSMFALAPVSFVLLLSIFTWFADGLPDVHRVTCTWSLPWCIGGSAILKRRSTPLYTGPHVVPTMSVAIGLVAVAAIGGAQQGHFR